MQGGSQRITWWHPQCCWRHAGLGMLLLVILLFVWLLIKGLIQVVWE